MTRLTGVKLAAYEARRVAQTTRTFSNWPQLLGGMVRERVGRSAGGDTLNFVTRTGLRLSSPNVPGARLPLYEQFADDCYLVDWVLGAPDEHPLQVLDVGSHVGAFAINLATSRPDVRVECYEPSPQSAAFLRRNVARNGLSGRIGVHQAALAGTAGTALLDDNSGASVHNGLVRDDHRLVAGDDAAGARGTVEVETVTFDDALAAAPAPFDIVKMDCEGAEYDLVYASSPRSWATVRRIVMEYHPVAGESWDELRTWFEQCGFAVHLHESHDPGLGTAWLTRVRPAKG